MRVALPEDFSEDSITVTANTLFIHFANDLNSFISTFMQAKYGNAWLQDLKVADNYYRDFNPKDPAALLKDLARNGSSRLRIALNSKIERGFLRGYYQDLDDLLGERNAWLHRQVQETQAELLDLLTSLIRVGKPLSLRIVDDCINLQNAILNPAPRLKAAELISSEALDGLGIESTLETNTASSQPESFVENVSDELTTHNEQIVGNSIEETVVPEETTTSAAISSMLEGEKFQIGQQITDPLLSHSYVLHLNGDIRDRVSDQLLASANPTMATTLGALLIARKPNGGRIRITAEGVLCAFFGEKWGYLANVKPEDWFPSHLPQLEALSKEK